MHVYVEDVDDVFQKAVAAGGTPVEEPTQKEGEPERRGGVEDSAGSTWWISTQQ